MCNARKIFKTAGAIANPIDAVVSNNVSKQNALRQLWHPERLGIASQTYGEGGALTIKSVADQGSAWSKSPEQTAALEYKAGAAERARVQAEQDATTAAN